jgi:hypothetical protein
MMRAGGGGGGSLTERGESSAFSRSTPGTSGGDPREGDGQPRTSGHTLVRGWSRAEPHPFDQVLIDRWLADQRARRPYIVRGRVAGWITPVPHGVFLEAVVTDEERERIADARRAFDAVRRALELHRDLPRRAWASGWPHRQRRVVFRRGRP